LADYEQRLPQNLVIANWQSDDDSIAQPNFDSRELCQAYGHK
jgi:hypothetical protein